MYRYFFKRLIDIVASLFLLLLSFPIMILVSIFIYLQDFGPVLFVHYRIGKNGSEFKFYKFRSMPVNTANVESKEVDKITITRFGKVIRRTNLDELPQLINILKGDMSLIGPRPCIPSQKNLIHLRKENGSIMLRPGLTGWAQVHSYDFMPEEEKAKLDGQYFQRLNFWTDLLTIYKTLRYLTKRPPTY